jgi:hypothetical protein
MIGFQGKLQWIGGLKIMDQPQSEEHSTKAGPDTQPYDQIVAEAIKASAQAEELKHTAIKRLLSAREQIDINLKMLGYQLPTAAPNQNGTKPVSYSSNPTDQPEIKRPAGPKPFRNMDLATVGKIILHEHDGVVVHGKDIEKTREGGTLRQRR